MPSNYTREVPIKFGEAGTHFLRFTWNSQIVFARETGGKSFEDYLNELGSLNVPDEERGLAAKRIITPEVLRLLLWVSLLNEDKNLTLDQVSEWMETAEGGDADSQYIYLFSKVMEAWGATKPAAVKKKVLEAARKLESARIRLGETSDTGSLEQPSTESLSTSSGTSLSTNSKS